MKFDFTFECRVSNDIINYYGVIVTSLKYETFKLYIKQRFEPTSDLHVTDKNYRLDSTPNIIHVRCLGKEWSEAFLRAYGVFLAEQILLSDEKRT